MKFLVLGPLRVDVGGRLTEVGAPRQRTLLGVLLTNANRVVPADRLLEEVWGDQQPAGGVKTLQYHISKLRDLLEPYRARGEEGVIGTEAGGYVLRTHPDQVDADRFERLAAEGAELLAADDAGAARDRLAEALALWRGEALVDFRYDDFAQGEIARLEELRLLCLENRIASDLELGRPEHVVGELRELTTNHPLRERLWGQLMVALYRTDQQAEALRAYRAARTALGEGLGIEPSPELRDLEERVLLQDRGLEREVSVPHNLPAELTSFIGRGEELIEVTKRLADHRLVTMVGPGGSGKTRLALRVAADSLNDYPNGVWFVGLRAVDEPAAVAATVAATLRVSYGDDRSLIEALVDALWSRRLLLVLDNCEHVLAAVAEFAHRLVERGGEVQVLATSREPLGVAGESTMLIPPLRLPATPDLDELLNCESARLFVDRATEARPDFALGRHASSVHGICHTLEGLPLALELAAARLRVLSPEELMVRLEDQLRMLRTPQTAGDVRHATMEATIQWSWNLLDEPERTLLSRLSLFPGSWTLPAAEAICGFAPIDRPAVLDLLARLVDKSLVSIRGGFDGVTRYRLLEPIRQFAARGLDEQGFDRLRSRHVTYWRGAMADIDIPTTYVITEAAVKQVWGLEPDQANLYAAVQWGLASGRFEDAMAIYGSAFGLLLTLQGSSFEIVSGWLSTALEHREEVSGDTLQNVLVEAYNAANAAFRNETALGYAELGMECARSTDERWWFDLGAAVAMNRIGRHADANVEFERIYADSRESDVQAAALIGRSQYERGEEKWKLVQRATELSPLDAMRFYEEPTVTFFIADAAFDTGRYRVAEEMAERSSRHSRRLNWRIMEGEAAALLAQVWVATGRLDEAARLMDDATQRARRILGPNITLRNVLLTAADVARLQGDFDTARSYIDETRRDIERRADGGGGAGALALASAALIARDNHDLAEAQTLLSRAAQRLKQLEQPHPYLRAMIRSDMASVALRDGRHDPALAHLGEVFAEPTQLDHLAAVNAVDLVAVALAQAGKADAAARLTGAVDSQREQHGLAIPPPEVSLRATSLDRARSPRADAWDAAVLAGRALTLAQAIALAAEAIKELEG